MWATLRFILTGLHPLLVPICLVLAWVVVLTAAWSVWSAVRDGVKSARRMHEIPCASCRFFTGNYTLKCPVHPTLALSEDAINCPDYDTIRIGDRILH